MVLKEFTQGLKKAYPYVYSNVDDAEALGAVLFPELLKDWQHTPPKHTAKKGKTRLKDIQISINEAQRLSQVLWVHVTLSTPHGKEVWELARSVLSDDPNWEVESIEAVN